MAKRFMFVCLGILCLAFAYHVGASNAQAESSSSTKVRLITAAGDNAWVVTEHDWNAPEAGSVLGQLKNKSEPIVTLNLGRWDSSIRFCSKTFSVD